MGVQLRSDTNSERGKTLSCLFWLDVLCAFRRNEKGGVLSQCFECPHYARFAENMEREEEAFWEEESKIRTYGYLKRFDVSKGGS